VNLLIFLYKIYFRGGGGGGRGSSGSSRGSGSSSSGSSGSSKRNSNSGRAIPVVVGGYHSSSSHSTGLDPNNDPFYLNNKTFYIFHLRKELDEELKLIFKRFLMKKIKIIASDIESNLNSSDV